MKDAQNYILENRELLSHLIQDLYGEKTRFIKSGQEKTKLYTTNGDKSLSNSFLVRELEKYKPKVLEALKSLYVPSAKYLEIRNKSISIDCNNRTIELPTSTLDEIKEAYKLRIENMMISNRLNCEGLDGIEKLGLVSTIELYNELESKIKSFPKKHSPDYKVIINKIDSKDHLGVNVELVKPIKHEDLELF